MSQMLVRGITHVVITTAPSAALSKSTGVVATASLCFGPVLTNAIDNIDLINTPKGMIWRLPSSVYMREGKPENRPIFRGAVAEEIGKWAAASYDRIRKETGGFKWRKVYTVPTGSASKVDIGERTA